MAVIQLNVSCSKSLQSQSIAIRPGCFLALPQRDCLWKSALAYPMIVYMATMLPLAIGAGILQIEKHDGRSADWLSYKDTPPHKIVELINEQFLTPFRGSLLLQCKYRSHMFAFCFHKAALVYLQMILRFPSCDYKVLSLSSPCGFARIYAQLSPKQSIIYCMSSLERTVEHYSRN